MNRYTKNGGVERDVFEISAKNLRGEVFKHPLYNDNSQRHRWQGVSFFGRTDRRRRTKVKYPLRRQWRSPGEFGWIRDKTVRDQEVARQSVWIEPGSAHPNRTEANARRNRMRTRIVETYLLDSLMTLVESENVNNAQ